MTSDTAPFACRRCGAAGPRLAGPPFPGPLGREIAAGICGACWTEWERREVMVINELRLNFMDPEAQAVLERALREFLFLESDPLGGLAGPPSPAPTP